MTTGLSQQLEIWGSADARRPFNPYYGRSKSNVSCREAP